MGRWAFEKESKTEEACDLSWVGESSKLSSRGREG